MLYLSYYFVNIIIVIGIHDLCLKKKQNIFIQFDIFDTEQSYSTIDFFFY